MNDERPERASRPTSIASRSPTVSPSSSRNTSPVKRNRSSAASGAPEAQIEIQNRLQAYQKVSRADVDREISILRRNADAANRRAMQEADVLCRRAGVLMGGFNGPPQSILSLPTLPSTPSPTMSPSNRSHATVSTIPTDLDPALNPDLAVSLAFNRGANLMAQAAASRPAQSARTPSTSLIPPSSYRPKANSEGLANQPGSSTASTSSTPLSSSTLPIQRSTASTSTTADIQPPSTDTNAVNKADAATEPARLNE